MHIQENISLVPLTTFRVGGPARFFARVRSSEEAAEALSWAEARSMPVFVLGGGTNVLAADEGFPGLVIKVENTDFEMQSDGSVTVGAGVPMGRVVQEAAKAGLTGFEWAAGLPGTVGGAIFGNAGAFGHATGEFIREVTVIGSAGVIGGSDPTILAPPEVQFRYRWSNFKEWPGTVIFRGVFQLKTDNDPASITAEIQRVMAARCAHQPLGDRSEGCIFKNPSAKQLAGKLIDECGLKGVRVGGAEVSRKHANFIVNIGSATARDIMQLILLIKQRVYEKTGIELEEEVRYLKA
ncbi:UDP-N-acetylmuramate dehydrogenase [Candidatus Parcubacteria bacterium]|nr:UDP-N-acetylmuramate dehydrogenase [Candidatus Parcubacteria bacterium]